jgi:SAM-dependent MidA family methyltransferase
MNSWLYSEDGYYSKYRTIGKEGDFFTSVSSSMFFGGSIANRLIKSIKDGSLPDNTTVVEVGAHRGYLMADIIQFIYTLEPKLLDTLKFVIVERFEHLREEQKRYFFDSFGKQVILQHIDDIKNLNADSAFIVANEIFDAFACELVYRGEKMAYIDSDFNLSFEDIDKQKEKHITKVMNRYNIDKGEVAVGYEEFARSMSFGAKKLEFITFDYGEKSPRPDFSIRVYNKHKTYPFFEEGLDISSLYKTSDITYDVNFTHLIDAFLDADIVCDSYKMQSMALIDFDILSLLEKLKKNTSDAVYESELNRVKTLISPSFLGDRFKMCRFIKE